MPLRGIEHGVDLWIRAKFRVLFARWYRGSWFWPAWNSTVIWRFHSIQSLNHTKNSNSSASSLCYAIQFVSFFSTFTPKCVINAFFILPFFFLKFLRYSIILRLWKLIFATIRLCCLRYLPGYLEYRPRPTGNKVRSRDKRAPLKRI